MHTRASITTIIAAARATVRMRLVSIRFSSFAIFTAKVQPASEKDVSLVGKYVSNLGIPLYYPTDIAFRDINQGSANAKNA